MDLVINKMMEFKVMHEAYCNTVIKRFSRTSVAKFYLSVTAEFNALPLRSVVSVFIELIIYIALKKRFPLFGEFFPVCIYIVICHFQRIHNINLVCAVKYRR